VFDAQGNILLLKRHAEQHCAGLWSFPGGKVETNEGSLAAAIRELHEETGLVGVGWQELGRQCFEYPDRILHFILFRCVCENITTLKPEAPHAWVEPAQLQHYAMPEANTGLIAMLHEDCESKPT